MNKDPLPVPYCGSVSSIEVPLHNLANVPEEPQHGKQTVWPTQAGLNRRSPSMNVAAPSGFLKPLAPLADAFLIVKTLAVLVWETC
jgi:hypothetical protein